MFVFKKHEIGNEKIIAIADKELIGKTFRFNNIEFQIKEEFYGNEEIGERETLELIKTGTIINAIGNNIVNLLIHHKIVSKEHVLHMDKIMHVQIIKV